MANEKERVDLLAVQQGLFPSREQAKRAIMAGEVLGKKMKNAWISPALRFPETFLYI